MRRWLHISDLHFNDDDMSTAFLRDELPKFLKRNNIRCDYIFCTGDIRTANATPNIFPDEAITYLKNLCTTVGVNTENLFIVPGNHDVDRNAPGREDAIKEICFHRNGYYDPKYGTIKEENLRALKVGQKDFQEFLAKLYTEDRMKKYTDPLKPHFNIETSDFNVLHIDSTLTYMKDQEASDLIIGTKLLYNALATINPEKPTILLSHYPYTALLQEEMTYVRELLYRNGVRLWLAGHEHDHKVQPVDYLDSFQAGELRMEERTRATILLGDFDERTNTGNVTAYTWFSEGWAKYPILWHDGKREDQYPFQLRLPGNNGRSREAVKADQANLEFIERVSVIESLLPSIEGVEGENLNNVLELAWNADSSHVILLADGGMGKTTMLLNLCKTSERLILYIPIERLVAIGIDIRKYCARVLFDGDEAAFEEFCEVGYSTPTLILLIDGLNEIDGKNERKFINEIKSLNLLHGIQFVISSRSDFTERYSIRNYSIGKLIPLSDEQIRTVFSTEEWIGIQDTFTLHKLLSNPMMVTMYKEISPIIKQFQNEECLNWIIPIKNSTDLLYNYYVAQIAVLLQRNEIDGQKAQQAYQIIFEILPALAYEFESSYSLNKENANCRVILQQIIQEYRVDEEPLFLLQERFRDYDLPELKLGPVLEFLTVETHLLYKDQVITAFPHQIYRDFLSAFWISKQTDIEKYWNQRRLSFPVMEHIRNLSGRYWDGLAMRVHEAGRNRENAFHLVENLLDCFPYSEEGGCPDYSELDLCGLPIPDVIEKPDNKIPLFGTRIDSVSIGKSSARINLYTHLCFSANNEFLAAFSDKKIFIFSLLTEEEPFVYYIDEQIIKMAFCDDYLFAATGGYNASIHVFYKKDMWKYNGKVGDSEETYNGINVSRLKNKDRRKRNKNREILWQTENSGLKATAMLDGSLIITSGDEIRTILAKGVTLLKDGAISGNGKWAATLSYEVKQGRRKVQLWDLDKKIRMKDIFCPDIIERIHLSEDGTFVIGETDSATWICEVAEEKEEWFSEHFISNQYRKITTYGNKVLRKNAEHDLYIYDLKTRMSSAIEQPCKNIRLACFMQDGTIAAVGNNSRKVKFRNIRTGRYLEVNSQDAAIIGISSLKNQPFIAVATQDKVISTYHIGDCMRKRIFDKTGGNRIMVISPENVVIACSDGRRSLQTFNYFEKIVYGERRGRWYKNPYLSKDPKMNGDILDIAFNTENQELVVILSSGQIMFCHEKYCRFHSATDIITNFDVDAYDFYGCICEDLIREQIRRNGGQLERR